MPLPRIAELGDWLHLTLLDGEDVLLSLKQIKRINRDKKSGGTAIYVDKEPTIVNEPIETVHKLIVSDWSGGTGHR